MFSSTKDASKVKKKKKTNQIIGETYMKNLTPLIKSVISSTPGRIKFVVQSSKIFGFLKSLSCLCSSRKLGGFGGLHLKTKEKVF